MKRWVVDTNVPIVANGGSNEAQMNRESPPELKCQLAAVEFLLGLLQGAVIHLDLAGEIQDEYKRHLNPKGQPGVGDQFYLAVINSGEHIRRIEIERQNDGQYVDLPLTLQRSKFDQSDRKFAALAHKTDSTVANCVDSDWHEYKELLIREGIKVQHLCHDTRSPERQSRMRRR